METLILSLHGFVFFLFLFWWYSGEVYHYTEKKKENKAKNWGKSFKTQKPSLPEDTLKLLEAFFCTVSYNFHRQKCALPHVLLCSTNVCSTFAHAGGGNGQARDLSGSTHSLRHIAGVCVPCCLFFFFFFRWAGKNRFQHLFRGTVVKAWQPPPAELQCDSTLTSSYQASIGPLPSESVDAFLLHFCCSQ